MSAFPLAPNRYPSKAYGRRCAQCGEWTVRIPTVLEAHPITVYLPGSHGDACPCCGWQRPHAG